MSNRCRRNSSTAVNYGEEDEIEFDDANGRESKKRSRLNSTKNASKKAGKSNSRSNKHEDEDDEIDDESDEDSTKDDENSPVHPKKSRKTSNSRRKKQEETEEESEVDENNEDDDADDDNGNESGSEQEEPQSSETSKRLTIVKTERVKIDPEKIVVSKSKKLGKLERLEEARQAFKWWEAEELPDGINWNKLEHSGIVFPTPYIPHNIPLLYDGKVVTSLTAEQEEMVTFYAAMPEDGPQLGNPKTRSVFQKNFFDDLKSMLTPGHQIQKFEKCDFSRIREHLALQKELRKAVTQEEKITKKAGKDSEMEKQGFALIDGRLEKMGNFRMEPPGLFRGRGEHPKTGCLKARQLAESVSVNVSADSCVPLCDVPGHAWQAVKHDPTVTWLCTWQENVQNQNKYVMLSASSSFKGKSDMEKYTKAINLKKHITKVRADYTKKIKSSDLSYKQLGTAMWVIDKLALRVGGEKGEDEADTVGCCSLRVEHLTFNTAAGSHEIELEFLGKDSMLYKQNINYAMYGELGIIVYQNLKNFCAGKKPDKDVFETLSPQILNKHLNSLMAGLTAKVFRTYNASITLENELPTAEDLVDLSIQEKVGRYNAANRSVAILCNHQKTVSKATEIMFENLNEKLEILKSQRNDLVSWKALSAEDKASKIPMKDDDKEVTDQIGSLVKEAVRVKEEARTTEEKLQATAALDDAKKKMKEDQKRRMQEKHLFRKGSSPTADDFDRRIAKWTEDIRKLEIDIRNRDENKEVALGTSKINYMDPRISVAWCKRCEVPIDKIFAKTLRDKFNWAMAVPPDWKFE